MTALDIIERLCVLPTARTAPATSPLSACAIVAGIEVAATTTSSEPALRKTWRDRRGGGATPLLLIADHPSRAGSILALGPVDASGPVRSVEAAALADVIERASSKSRLEAVRELAAELERLDQAGIPGLKLRDLLTLHTLDVRLRNDAPRWQEMTDATGDIERGADWRTVLTKLGYMLERRKHRGYLVRLQGRPVAVIHPKADAAEFSRLDEEARPPEGVLLNDCHSEGAPFGILASGSRMRLFEADPALGASVAQYLDLDAGALQVDDRPLLGLLGPEFLARGGFKRLRHEARQLGSAPTGGGPNRAYGRWASPKRLSLQSSTAFLPDARCCRRWQTGSRYP